MVVIMPHHLDDLQERPGELQCFFSVFISNLKKNIYKSIRKPSVATTVCGNRAHAAD